MISSINNGILILQCALLQFTTSILECARQVFDENEESRRIRIKQEKRVKRQNTKEKEKEIRNSRIKQIHVSGNIQTDEKVNKIQI